MSEIDRDLDAAWRATSREEPPAALDDAIRARARREVGAGPRREGRTRAWWPLAAAATVAALAIGIAQLTPPERVSPDIAVDVRPAPGVDKVAANQAPPPTQAAAKAESDVAPLDAARADKPTKIQGAALQARKEKSARPAAEEQVAARMRDRADEAQNATADRGAAKADERERKQESAPASATTPAPSIAAAPPAEASRSVPFPASPDRAKLAEQVVPAMPAPPPAAAPALPRAATAAGALASNAEPAAVEKRMAMAKTANEQAHRESNAPPRPVDEWIKEIRRLIAEGKLDDAAKELTAFRALYKDRAESMLPRDLRDFKR